MSRTSSPLGQASELAEQLAEINKQKLAPRRRHSQALALLTRGKKVGRPEVGAEVGRSREGAKSLGFVTGWTI